MAFIVHSRQGAVKLHCGGCVDGIISYSCTGRGPAVQLLCDGEPNTWTWNEMENHMVKPPLRPKLVSGKVQTERRTH